MRLKLICLTLLISGCATVDEVEPADPASGDAWTYEATVGNASGKTVWRLEETAEQWHHVWQYDSVDRQVGHAWGDDSGLRGMSLESDRQLGAHLFEGQCYHPMQPGFVPKAVADCQHESLTIDTDFRYYSTGSPRATITTLPPTQLEGTLFEGEATRVRIDFYLGAADALSGAHSLVYWMVEAACAPVRIDTITFEGSVNSRLDATGMRCSEASWGDAVPAAPMEPRAHRADAASSTCHWDFVNNYNLRSGEAPQARCSTATLLSSQAGDTRLQVEVSWTGSGDANLEHTLQVGEHSITGASPLTLDVPARDFDNAQWVNATGVAPSMDGDYWFTVTAPFPSLSQPAWSPYANW